MVFFVFCVIIISNNHVGFRLITTIVAIITAIITGLITFAIQERKLKMELRTEFMAEQAAKSLLENERWNKRSFEEIKKSLVVLMMSLEKYKFVLEQ